jgi:DNA invertase Pin-like site-specific DNA recombinase
LEEKGIQLASLTKSIDTSTSSGKLFFHVFGVIAEFDENLINKYSESCYEKDMG